MLRLPTFWVTAAHLGNCGCCPLFVQSLPTFWATRGFYLPAARTGAGGRPEPRARWEGPYGTRGGRVAVAAAAAGDTAEPAAAAEAAAGCRWAALGRRGPPRAALGRRGRFGVEWGGPCVTQPGRSRSRSSLAALEPFTHSALKQKGAGNSRPLFGFKLPHVQKVIHSNMRSHHNQ